MLKRRPEYTQSLLTIVAAVVVSLAIFYSPMARAQQANVPVTALAWSPDGARLAIGMEDGAIQIKETIAGGVLLSLRGHTGRIGALVWSPDNSQLASGGYDCTVRIWSATDGRLIYLFEGHLNAVVTLAWSPDGNRLASTSAIDDPTPLRIWNPKTGQLISSYAIAEPIATAWSPDSSTLASAIPGGGGIVNLLDVSGLNQGSRLIIPDSDEFQGVYSVVWNHDGSRLVTGSLDGVVRVWDVSAKQPLFGLRGNDQPEPHIKESVVWAVAFCPNGQRVASFSADGTLRTWNATTGDLISTGNVGRSITVAAWSPDGSLLAYSGLDGVVSIDETPSLSPIDASSQIGAGRPEGSWVRLRAADWSPDGRYIAVVVRNGPVKILEVSTGQTRVLLLEGHTDRDVAIAWSPDGMKLAASGADNAITVWNTVTGQALFSLPDPPYASSVAWSPDGTRLVTGSEGGNNGVRIWSGLDGRFILATTPGGSNLSLAWGQDGHTVAIGRYGRVELRNAADLQLRSILSTDTGQEEVSVAWSFISNLLASGNLNNNIQIWDPSSGQLMHVLSGHTDFVNSVAWHPDGHHLASASGDGTVRFWDVDTAQTLKIINVGNPVFFAAWSPDGSKFAYDGDDGTVRIVSGEMSTRFETKAESPTPTPQRTEGQSGGNSTVTVIAWSRNGSRVAGGTRDGQILVWNFVSGTLQLQLSFPAHDGAVSTLDWSPDNTRLVSGGGDAKVKVWDAATGASVATLYDYDAQALTAVGLFSYVYTARWSPDGQWIVSVQHDKFVLNETTNWSIAYDYAGGTLAGADWSPDSQLVAFGNLGGIVVFDVGTQQFLPRYEGAVGLHTVRWNPDGTRLAGGNINGWINVWQRNNPDPVTTFHEESKFILDIAWSPDGVNLATLSEEGVINIRNATTWQVEQTIQQNPPEIGSISWSPDGQYLAYADNGAEPSIVPISLAIPMSTSTFVAIAP
jgi:WD40 repeat protein